MNWMALILPVEIEAVVASLASVYKYLTSVLILPENTQVSPADGMETTISADKPTLGISN